MNNMYIAMEVLAAFVILILIYANIDELTGLYNRSAYEDEVLQQEEAKNDLLVYASIDVNGLKIVNDNHR